MPTIEFISFNNSEALRKSSAVLDDTVNILRSAEGIIRTYVGLQVEDPTVAYFVNIWHALKYHTKLQEAPEYPVLVNSMGPALGPSPNLEMLHFEFPGDPRALLASHTPAFVLASPKPGKTTQDVEAILAKYAETLTQHAGEIGGFQGVTWGPVVERTGTYALWVGWDTVEAHLAAPGHASLGPVVRELVDTAILDLKHGTLEVAAEHEK